MDLKEQIIKFLNEETSQVRTLDGEGFAITLDNYKEDTEYLADELIKLFSLHSVIECLEQVNATLERHGKVEADTDLHNKIRNTL